MLRLKLKLYTYHTFLVVPFIVLFLYAHNIGISKAEMTLRTLVLGSLLAGLLYLPAQVFFKNRLKTGIFVSLLLFGLFQYGVLYEFLCALEKAGYWPFSNTHRYLLFLYFTLFLFLLVFFKKTKHDFIRINYFLNFLVILLIGFNGLKIILHKGGQSSLKAENPENSMKLAFNDSLAKPDIYYIVLDGYASSAVLKKNYHFDNGEFYGKLQDQGFRFSDSAFANYYTTTRSLCATMNMLYTPEDRDALEGIRNNGLMQVLRSNGYRIYHMRSGYSVTRSFNSADSTVDIGGPNEFELSLFKHTVLRLDDGFGFFPAQRLRSQFEKMYVMAEISSQPKFCFLHFVAPHPPFVFEKDGEVRRKHFNDENLWPKAQYLDQLSYLNTQIAAYLNYLVQRNPSAVILLQSDHGPYTPGKTVEEVFESREGILYAYKYPDSISIPAKTSAVNSFRYLLNGLFNSKLDILKDERPGKDQFMKAPVLGKLVEGELPEGRKQ